MRRFKNKSLNRLRGVVKERLPSEPPLELLPLPVAIFSENEEDDSDYLECRDTSSELADLVECGENKIEVLKGKLQG